MGEDRSTIYHSLLCVCSEIRGPLRSRSARHVLAQLDPVIPGLMAIPRERGGRGHRDGDLHSYGY